MICGPISGGGRVREGLCQFCRAKKEKILLFASSYIKKKDCICAAQLIDHRR